MPANPGFDRLFDEGARHPEPILDVPTIQEVRLRVLGMLFARQVEVLQLQHPDELVPNPQSDDELIGAVAKIRDLKRIRGERQDEAEEIFGSITDLLDELEERGLRQADH